MSSYRQPQTRIKRVKDGDGVRYYDQYKMVIIPFLWWEWHSTRPFFNNSEYSRTLEAAEARVDHFLRKHKHDWASGVEKAARKQVKTEVEYISYP